MSPLIREVVQVVREVDAEENRPATAWDVTYTLGLSTQSAGQALKRAFDKGLIQRVCRGRYALPGKGPVGSRERKYTLLLEHRVNQIHAYAQDREVTLRELESALGGIGYHATRRAIIASRLVFVRRLSDAKIVYRLP